MKYLFILSAFLSITVIALAADTPQKSPVAGAPPAWEQYQSIVHQNIFIRDRVRPNFDTPGDSQDTVKTVPRPHLALRGIVLHGETFVAFVEDIDFSDVMMIQVNDTLADGEIVDLSLESIQFKKDDVTRTVNIGQWIDGTGDVSSSPSFDYDTDASYTPSSGTTANTEEELSIIERLRRRREAELGKDSTP